MTVIYILKSENGECHRIHGATMNLATAEGWIENIQLEDADVDE